VAVAVLMGTKGAAGAGVAATVAAPAATTADRLWLPQLTGPDHHG
jgi:hypothetical protein